MAVGFPYLKLGHKFRRNSVIFQPSADSTTFLQVLDADGGTPILNIDSTNERVGIGTDSPTTQLHVNGVATPSTNQFLLQANLLGGLSFVCYSADNCFVGFDAEWKNSTFKSLDAGSNFLIYKNSDLLQFQYDSSVAVGSNTAFKIGMVMDSSGNVGIGTTSPDTLLELSKASADTELTISCYHDTEATTPKITLRKADNTEASPALVDDNAVLGTVSFQGHDGSGWHEGAKIEARIDGTPSDGTDMPTELTFWTTADAAGSPTERMSIGPDGKTGLGTGTPDGLFHVLSGSAGSVTADGAADEIIMEGSGNTGMSILTPDANFGRWLFGSPSDNYYGGLEGGYNGGSPQINLHSNLAGGYLIFGVGNNSEAMRITASGNVGVQNNSPQGALSIGDIDEGRTAGLDFKVAREVHTLANAATSDTSINIPADCMLLGAAFCVNTAVTDDGGDDTWSAAFNDGAGMHTLVSGAAAAQNTKANKLVDSSATSTITDAVTNVQFTPNGGNFTAGVIEVLVWYIDMTDLANA